MLTTGVRLAVAVPVFLAIGAGAQQKPPSQAPPTPQTPVFRTGVDLVQIDVVVLDADGQPVRGLTRDDFSLFDRGIKQEIATFAAKTHDRPPPDPFPAPLPLDVADNRSAKSDRLVIIILDDLHFRGRTTEAMRLVRRTVEELGDSVSLGLVTTSGTFGVEVTEDRARLLLAVEQFVDRLDRPMFAALYTYKTLEDVARMAGANDGRRKAFIWITPGAQSGMHGNANFVDTCKNLKGASPTEVARADDFVSMSICGMYEKLFRSGVVVYPVSPGGPSDGGGSRAMADITNETGGFLIRASNVDAGMTRLLSDLDNYYLLGFYPAEQGRAGYRPIEVIANRPGLTVRHRVGYHAKGPVPPPRNESPLGALVAPISPNPNLHLRMSAIPFFTTGSSMQLLTTIEVDLGELPQVAASGLMRDELEFAVFAVDLKKKKVTRSASRKVLVDWPPEHREKPGAERFLVQTVLTVPPGAYQLRASTLSKTPEKSGSVYLQVDVPEEREQPIGLSGILLGSDAAVTPQVVESKPLVGLTVPFSPSLDREFTTGETLRVFFQVRRKQARTAVTGTVRLLDPDGVEVAHLPWTVAAMAPGAVSLAMPLSGVTPGAYRLMVGAADGKNETVGREVRIRVIGGS